MRLIDCVDGQLKHVVADTKLRELRLRCGKPIAADLNGQRYFVTANGYSTSDSNAIVADGEMVQNLFQRATESSIYTYEQQLMQGYLTLSDGVRVGVAGEISTGASGKFFRKINSMCIRLPHDIYGASSCVWGIDCGNLLVCGKPSSGKTTFIRDYAVYLSRKRNVLVVDERGEISQSQGFRKSVLCDVLLWADKKYCFELGIRSMSPEVIVCDELASDDSDILTYALNSGVNVVATLHASSEQDAMGKLGNAYNLFQTVVMLENPNKPALIIRNHINM